MKIITPLLDDKRLREIREKDPKMYRELEDLGKAYIELDTNSKFDDLPREIQISLKKILASYLSEFGRILLTAIEFDTALALEKGMDTRPATKAIDAAINEMYNQVDIAMDIVE